MLANSPVHLYKLNPATRAYDAIEGGGLLGCVLMGSGLNFQLLIYNAQVISFNIRYLSFTQYLIETSSSTDQSNSFV